MKEVRLFRGEIALVDDEDFDLVAHRRWHRTNGGYARSSLGGGKYVLMHRLIVGLDADGEVDHIDGNGLNNARGNLRLCSHAENMRNRGPARHNKCGFKGVYERPSGNFRARLRIDGREIHLGYFASAKEAHAAYVAAARELHGEFARVT